MLQKIPKRGNFPKNPIGIFYQYFQMVFLLSQQILLKNKFSVFFVVYLTRYDSDPTKAHFSGGAKFQTIFTFQVEIFNPPKMFWKGPIQIRHFWRVENFNSKCENSFNEIQTVLIF